MDKHSHESMGTWNIILITHIVFISQGNGFRLILNNAGLTSIPEITNRSITEVRLDGNAITSIPANTMTNSSVTRLYMKHNKIISISQDAFKGTILRYLVLPENPLSKFPYFPNIKNHLRLLHLGNCNITNETWNLNVNYTHLYSLDLSFNDIKHVPNMGNSKSKLRYLYLAGCGIHELQPYVFSGVERLYRLN